MANALATFLGNVASAIKTQLELPSSTKMKPTDFATRILSIPKGIDTVEIDRILDNINGESIGDIVIAEGSCGTNAYYTLKDSGLLYIEGEGDISSKPWYNDEALRLTVKKLVIADGITSIGKSSSNIFQGLDNLTTVSLSSTLTVIGTGAFTHCDSLTSITIPASVTTIYAYAFSDCPLERMTFTDTVGWGIYQTDAKTLVVSLSSSDVGNATKMAQYWADRSHDYFNKYWLKK